MSVCYFCGSASDAVGGLCPNCGGTRRVNRRAKKTANQTTPNRPARKWAATGILVSIAMFWSPFIVLIFTLFVSALAKPWGIDVSGLWALIDWNTGLVGHVTITALVLSIPLGMLFAAFGGLNEDSKIVKE